MIMDKFEKQKVTHLLEYSEEELNDFLNNADDFFNGEDYFYDILMKILQQGYNIREVALLAMVVGKKIGYEKAKAELEDEIKDKLYKAFKNNS